MKELSLYETRVIGCLIEKSLTTPEQYPLSLNALTNACNQKSNRYPVLELAEATVQDACDSLVEAGLVGTVMGSGSRVAKYQHRFGNTEFSEYKFSAAETVVICMLFLRGPQTPGELRTRCQRLYEFRDVQALELVLHTLMSKFERPFVAKLAREAGKRESRYVHLFSGDDLSQLDSADTALSTRTGGSGGAENLAQRVEVLESKVEDLQAQLEELRQLLDDLTS